MKLKIKDLYNEIMKSKAVSQTILLGIDGCGGAGKSTLAEAFKKIDINKVTIVHMDDFYKTSKVRELVLDNEIGGYWDCNRVKEQVLIPLHNNKSSQYQIYDWNEDKLGEWHTIPLGGLVIIEGCYSLRESLRDFYDFKIWVESPKDLRLCRGIERDGEEKRHLWEGLWMPSEEYYKEIEKPFDSVDLVIDGTGENGNIENLEVAVLRGSIS